MVDPIIENHASVEYLLVVFILTQLEHLPFDIVANLTQSNSSVWIHPSQRVYEHSKVKSHHDFVAFNYVS